MEIMHEGNWCIELVWRGGQTGGQIVSRHRAVNHRRTFSHNSSTM